MHYGNIGSFIGGLAAVVIAIVSLWFAPSAFREWRAKLEAEKHLAREREKEIRINRYRSVQGWMIGGVDSWAVDIVVEPTEIDGAMSELRSGEPTAYVLVRCHGADQGGRLRRWLENRNDGDRFLARVPTMAEYEALQLGREVMRARDSETASA